MQDDPRAGRGEGARVAQRTMGEVAREARPMALALTSRRSTVAAVASALAAMALAAAVAGRSCRVTQPGPEAAVRDMLQAAKTGDRDTVFELLAPRDARRGSTREARRATDLVGASMRYTREGPDLDRQLRRRRRADRHHGARGARRSRGRRGRLARGPRADRAGQGRRPLAHRPPGVRHGRRAGAGRPVGRFRTGCAGHGRTGGGNLHAGCNGWPDRHLSRWTHGGRLLLLVRI